MATKDPLLRKGIWRLLTILVLSIASLLTLALVGVAGWLTYIGSSSNATPPAPRPADNPVLVEEPMSPDTNLPPLVALPDLSQVDRHLIEPNGLVKPRYCLLVFGPQAKSRVWIVEDGETIYVDRNGNGNLREDGEAFTPSEFPNPEYVDSFQWTYYLGDLTPGAASEKHTGLKLIRYRRGNEPMQYILSVYVGGALLQYAGWRPLFTDSRATAPVVHFGGPVVPKPLRVSELHLNEEPQELHFCIGTPGLGKHSFAYVGYEAAPEAPVLEIAWPSEGGAFKERFALTHRC